MISTEMTRTGPVRGRKEGLRADYSRIQKSVNPELYQKVPVNDKFWSFVAKILTKVFKRMYFKEISKL